LTKSKDDEMMQVITLITFENILALFSRVNYSQFTCE